MLSLSSRPCAAAASSLLPFEAMADPRTISPSDIQLLRKEIEVQGELLSAERLERKAEVDGLRLQLDVLKKAVAALDPRILQEFERLYAEERLRFNPESPEAA